MTDPIRLGTRASLLARTQSKSVGDALAARSGREWTEVLITTSGDDTSKPLHLPHSAGLFVSALRDALLENRVDVVVHSFKDLPSAPVRGITIGAVPPREDSRDALVSRAGLRLAELPSGAVVGTSSPRRAAALAALRPDLVIAPIRGNVDSRVRKVRDGEFDAAVLAVAGLRRIGRESEIAEILASDLMLPAPAQGALAVECRADDDPMLDLLSLIDDPVSRLLTAAEREVLVGVGASCTTAIASQATYIDGALELRAELSGEYGIEHAFSRRSVSIDPGDLSGGRMLGLRAAADLLGAADSSPVLLVRSEGNDGDVAALTRLGIGAVCDPYVEITPVAADGLLAALADHDWLVVSSPMTIPSWLATVGEPALRAALTQVRVAAVGERSAASLRDLGCVDVLVPETASAEGMVAAMSGLHPQSVVLPRGNLALPTLPDGLRALQWDVTEGVVYETSTVERVPASVDLIRRGDVAAIVVRSPSAVRALLSFIRPAASIPIVCGGPTTAKAAAAAGLVVSAVSSSPDSASVSEAVRRALKPAQESE